MKAGAERRGVKDGTARERGTGQARKIRMKGREKGQKIRWRLREMRRRKRG